MSDFSTKQVRALKQRLNRAHVQTREVDGKPVDYIEGWFAISEANAIFGFSGWDREMTHFERVFERGQNDWTSCGYLARVRVRVRAGDAVTTREGTGFGLAKARNVGEAHERALKAAETDATKRALATFGNRFGLSLYDKEQQGVTGTKPVAGSQLVIRDAEGALLIENLSPETFCSALRQILEKTPDKSELEALWRSNAEALNRLKHDAPQLKTEKGVHYADILTCLAEQLLGRSPAETPPEGLHAVNQPAPLKESRIAAGPRIDKSMLTIGTERRLRDKAHLKAVGLRPCLVCGRQPSHAHHLTFAQPRGLSLKVSDEYVVPLCALHHGELHRGGQERSWWAARGVDPLPVAAELWATSRNSATSEGPDTLDLSSHRQSLDSLGIAPAEIEP